MSPLFLKQFAKKTRSLKPDAGIRSASILSQSEQILQFSWFIFMFVSNMWNKCQTNVTFFNLFPKAAAPRPHGTPPKRCASKFPATWTRFHPDWTKWHPIHAHFSFQIEKNNHPNKTVGHSGNHLAEERKSSSFHLLFVSWLDLTISQYPFLCQVI